MFKRSLVIALLASPLLAACASIPAPGPVSVTRYSDAGQAARMGSGTVFVETAPGTDLPAAELAEAKAAVARELARLGYTETSRAEASTIAQVSVERFVTGADAVRRSPVSVGVGGGTGTYGSGMGLGIGINLGGGGPHEQLATQMGVMLRDAQSGASYWEGRAQFTVDTRSPMAQSAPNADAVADALFRDFPGNNGETVDVRISN